MKKLKMNQLAGILAFSLSFYGGNATADAVVVTNAAEISSPIVMAVNGATSAITSGTSAIVQAILKLSTQNQANAERQNVVLKNITEAAQNYDKDYRLQEHIARIDREVGDTREGSAAQNSACNAIAVTTNLATAISDKREIKKQMAVNTLKINTLTEDPQQVARRGLATHFENFCSEEDKERGRCKNLAPVELQNADLKAETLLEPNETYTYGEKESIAAKSYIDSLISHDPAPVLSKKAESTPAGRAYLTEQHALQRKLDIPAHSLREIVASREEVAGLGVRANMGTQNASVMGVINHYASKFLDPQWNVSIGSLSKTDLMKEQARMMAFSNWMDYQTYMQLERTEAMVATQLLDQVKASSEARLDRLRSRAQTMNAQ